MNLLWAAGKVAIAAIIISFASWLAGKRPTLAGFVIALPLSSMIALALNHTEFSDTSKSVTFARSIFAAIPLSLLFFVPFLFAERLRLGFWGLFFGGVILLIVGFLIHSQIFR